MTTSAKSDNEIHNNKPKELLVIRPICEMLGRIGRMEQVLGDCLTRLEAEGIRVTLVEKVSELEDIPMPGKKVIFAICLSESGVNLEYYRLLEAFRLHPHCLDGSVGGIIVDGASDLYTKALARRMAFSANSSGCTFPGKPLVEATGTLANFRVLSQITGKSVEEVYALQVENLMRKVLDFDLTDAGWCYPDDATSAAPLHIAAIHSGSRKTSNTLLLWDMIRRNLPKDTVVEEVSLRNGSIQDCRGCTFETCRHFGEKEDCFYGGIMTEKVFPAILRSDAVMLISPNYNDALSANLTAMVNRLTALFRTHDFSKKRIYSLVVSGYSGGDIVSEQILGAFCFNKNFILPGRFAIVETANDPGAIFVEVR
ncbi:MAG: NAD(P)H-dependent oxidoreductase [Clostridia bacterium]|nr:NAD(P)H-dependent oxidoreductase [Clostridia bacterium]